MRIIAYKAIEQYSVLRPDAKLALDEWYIKTEQCQWNCFADVKQTFNSVDSAGNKRYVFNIKSKAQYEAIMARVDELVEIVDDNTPQTNKHYVELDFLADLIVEYEKEHYQIGKSSKQERVHAYNMQEKEIFEVF